MPANTPPIPPDNRPGNQLPDSDTAHKTRNPYPTYRPAQSIFTPESLQLPLPFPQSANYQVNDDLTVYYRANPVDRVTITHKMAWLTGDEKEILSEIIKVARDFVIPVKNLARYLSIEVLKNYDTTRWYITLLKKKFTIYEADVVLDEEVDNQPTGRKVTKKCIIVNPYAIRIAHSAIRHARKIKDGEAVKEAVKDIIENPAPLAEGIPTAAKKPAKKPAPTPPENLENSARFDTAAAAPADPQTPKNAGNPGIFQPGNPPKNAGNPGIFQPGNPPKNAGIPGIFSGDTIYPGYIERESDSISLSQRTPRTPGGPTAKKIDTDTVRYCARCNNFLASTRKSDYCARCD